MTHGVAEFEHCVLGDVILMGQMGLYQGRDNYAIKGSQTDFKGTVFLLFSAVSNTELQ